MSSCSCLGTLFFLLWGTFSFGGGFGGGFSADVSVSTWRRKEKSAPGDPRGARVMVSDLEGYEKEERGW